MSCQTSVELSQERFNKIQQAFFGYIEVVLSGSEESLGKTNKHDFGRFEQLEPR